MVQSIKGLTLDANGLKAKMSRDAREVGLEFEAKASLQKEVSAMKDLVLKVKEEFNTRAVNENKILDELI